MKLKYLLYGNFGGGGGVGTSFFYCRRKRPEILLFVLSKTCAYWNKSVSAGKGKYFLQISGRNEVINCELPVIHILYFAFYANYQIYLVKNN
jgi:hypothetical protein